MKKAVRAIAALVVLSSCMIACASPVDDIGALRVVGNEIRGGNNQVARLRGMSLYWSQAKAGRDFYNAGVVEWLATDWHANVIRAAMAIEGNWSPVEQGYLSDPATNRARVKTVVDAAIQKGIYVIIDWHDHNATAHQSQAISFFSEMAQQYGNKNNVIYEIFNEPDDESWSAIKSYSIEVIKAIRQYDPDNLIVVGTPKWSSDVDVASQSPITGYTNIAYAFHFYASEAWHYNNYRQKAETALNSGIALFVTEWGCSEASGTGTINFNYVNTFMSWMESKKLSWCNWSICDLSETSAALKAGTWNAQGNLVHAVSTTGNWAVSDLSASGAYVRDQMRSLNPAYSIPVSVVFRDMSERKSLSAGLRRGVHIDVGGNGQGSSEMFDIRGKLVDSKRAANMVLMVK